MRFSIYGHKKDSENKFSDTFKIKDFEVFEEISFGNVSYSKPSIEIIIIENETVR